MVARQFLPSRGTTTPTRRSSDPLSICISKCENRISFAGPWIILASVLLYRPEMLIPKMLNSGTPGQSRGIHTVQFLKSDSENLFREIKGLPLNHRSPWPILIRRRSQKFCNLAAIRLDIHILPSSMVSEGVIFPWIMSRSV